MIHLHTPVIKERYYPKKNSLSLDRLNSHLELNSVVTNSVIDNIFGDDIIRNIFIKLVTLIEPWIYLHTNIKLVDNEHLPLIGEETINLIARGENVISYYFNEEKKKYSDPNGFFDQIMQFISPKITQLTQTTQSRLPNETFFEKYSNYFKISDIDFNLNIKTSTINRFEVIEKYAIESLIEILNILTDGFDLLHDYSDNFDLLKLSFTKVTSIPVKNISIDYYSEKLNVIKQMMAIPNFKYSTELMLHPTSQNLQNARQSNFKLVKLIEMQLEELMLVTDDIMFFPYIYYFSKMSGKTLSRPFINYDKFNNAIRNEINKYFDLLVEYQLYDIQKRKNTVTDILSKLNELKHKTFYINSSNIDATSEEYVMDAFFDKINLPSHINANNLETIPTQSTYLYNDIEGVQKIPIEKITSKKHFIVMDQTLASSTRADTYIVDLDTIKVKLNIILKNTLLNDKLTQLAVPADFIDITVNRINSTAYVDIVSAPYKLINLQGNADEKLPIKVHDKKTLIRDLMKNLFDGEHFLPWHIDNYDQALMRLLFLLNIDEHEYIQFINNLLTSDNKKSIVDYTMFYRFDYESYSFYNLVWIDPVIAKKYYEIEHIIKFVLVMDELIKLSDQEFNNILKDFQSSYGWINDLDAVTVKKSYLEFRNVLLKIVDMLSKIR